MRAVNGSNEAQRVAGQLQGTGDSQQGTEEGAITIKDRARGSQSRF